METQTIISNPISDITFPDHEIFYVSESETIANALKTLQSKNIRTIAVSNDKDGKLQGLVTVYDIMTYICFACYEYDKIPNEIKAIGSMGEPIGNITRKIHEETKRTLKFEDNEPISILLEFMSLGFHQGVVCSRKGETKFISQHDLVNYFISHPFEEASKPLREIGFGYPIKSIKPKCVNIESNHSALYAFRKMEVEGFSALPVIDPKSKEVVATISSGDVRNISIACMNDVLMNVLDFLKHIYGEIPQPLTCSPDVTLLSIMEKLVETHHRHAWIVDEEGRHIDTVSLSDIISFPSKGVKPQNNVESIFSR